MKSKMISLPYLIWMLVFTIVPLGLVVFFAFTTPEGQFTLDNLTNAGQYISVLLRSIWLALIATAICLLIAYPLSYILSRMHVNRQRTFIMLVMLPMWINFLLRTYAWMTLLENNGLINRFFGLFGLGPFNLINTEGAVVLGMVYNYLPFMILPLYSILTKIDNSLIEAAQDLGAPSRKVFAKVVIPMSMPGITTGITMVFVPAISTFIISRMLGGGSNLLIGDLIDLQFLGNAYNPNLGAAISLVLMVLILLFMSIVNQFDDERTEGMLL
ncbi:ABC transporter permease [Candidatus Soleaferrea massiliensis]|uniref:ABC transporter permease n=1 Tax=Candidatus Soleaferrea massiliensis TaxID=1470354 RepID=UPI00058DEAF4|nr:ABC transporter permease [Candidatus Soleaferrea massiliensis]